MVLPAVTFKNSSRRRRRRKAPTIVTSPKNSVTVELMQDALKFCTIHEGVSVIHPKETPDDVSSRGMSFNINGLCDQFPSGVSDAKKLSECVIEIQKKLVLIVPHQGGHSIFEVPRSLQRLEPNAFTPQIVSIGPYHRRNEQLNEMETHKWRLLDHVLKRTGLPLEFLVAAMFQLEPVTKDCYENIDKHTQNFSPQDFVEMMLLDACFLLELFVASDYGYRHRGYTLDDPIFTSRGISPFIQRDLLMLENQLPLFVVDRLFSLTCDQIIMNDSVSELALRFFNSAIPGVSENLPNFSRNKRPPLHLLDLVRQSVHPSPPRLSRSLRIDNTEENELLQVAMHSVTRLRGTGIRFRQKCSTKFTNIKFEEGVLLIPRITIHDATKSIFLNLMAFEQCYPQCSPHVTSYLTFMDGLIDSSKDVEHLCDKGIIEHGLGSEEEVANLFNNLRKEIAFDTSDYYLRDVSRDLNEHFDRKWHTWKALLMHEYLKHPWKIISLVAATLLIVLTLAQTTYAILSYHVPHS